MFCKSHLTTTNTYVKLLIPYYFELFFTNTLTQYGNILQIYTRLSI
jgi:hypothetical protein